MSELTTSAIKATLHCLLGCAIGEILGMVIGTWLGLHDALAIGLSIVLAFVFGYTLSLLPIVRAGVSIRKAFGIALAADTVSITSMEIVDNLVIVLIPGALMAGLADGLFWGSLGASLVIAFLVTVPVNRWFIARGKGHAVAHAYHQGHQH